MSRVMNRASLSAGKRKKVESSQSSDNSDTLQAALDEAQRRQEEKRALKERRAEGAAIKKRLDEQYTINGFNARQLKALAAERDKYQVILFIKINCCVVHSNCCVLAE
jgi:hypothetical protein